MGEFFRRVPSTGHRFADASRRSLIVLNVFNIFKLFVFQKQYTLLMCAARNNRLSVVNFLLDTIDDVGLDAFDTDHQTALHHAAFAGHTHVVRRLVHAGANTSTTNKVKSKKINIHFS